MYECAGAPVEVLVSCVCAHSGFIEQVAPLLGCSSVFPNY